MSVWLAFGAFCSVWYGSMKFYIVFDQELVWSVAFCCRHLIVPWPSVSVCLALGAFCSVCSSHMVVRALGWHCPAVYLVSTCVVPCARSVFIALLVWRCGLNYSLAVLGVPSLSRPFFSAFFFFHQCHLAWVWWVPVGGLTRGAHGLVAGWTDQLGVLAPWGCDCGH